jgi:YfiH family protein
LFADCNFCEKSDNNWKVDNSHVTYFVTDRWGGSSKVPYAELNMGMSVGDCVDDVLYNRLLIARHTSLPLNRFVFASQVHGDHIAVIEESDLSEDSYSVIKKTDGLISKARNIALIVLAADCVPVFLYDRVKGVVGAFHAGWRGLCNQIVLKGLQMMTEQFGCQTDDITSFIGPSIGQCCYEVKSKVLEKVKNNVPTYEKAIKTQEGKSFLDLKKGIKLQLLSKGLIDSNITVSKDCTKCNTDIYFSYRAEQETGRFCAGIALWG